MSLLNGITSQDVANAGFEFVGAGMMLLNIGRVLRDREVKGSSILTASYFVLWGFWNTYYYPHLGQLASFVAGLCLAVANTVWFSLFLACNLGLIKPVAK
jgi:hypothetical protein